MKVLVIGSGGREHALAWKLSKSNIVTNVFVAPGNGGTEIEELIQNIDIDANDIETLSAFAKKEGVDLTIVGPEDPLVDGITDKFQEEGLLCFGPSKDAARLEGSKEFMKDFLIRHNIPTASYETFTDSKKAISYIKEQGCPIVIKADGLAAGKGVTVAFNTDQAIEAVNQSLESKTFGEAGSKIVVEEYLEGEEASFIVLTDGNTVIPFASSQDHKARDEGDLGPNTGGMGAYSPAPVVTRPIHEKILKEVIHPTVEGLKSEGSNYCGFLYAGIMVDANAQIKVLEFNCRFGDPETQPIMMRLKTDLAQLCLKACKKELSNEKLDWDERKSLGVVMASGGYPFAYEKGNVIEGITEESEDLKVFHAGTIYEEGNIKSSGGRVLCVTALGDSVSLAQKKAYDAISSITWKDCFYRNDIGYRAIEREKN
jgi:phosphoribosylamine--glycine ligase